MATADTRPTGLDSPDRGVVWDRERGVCYDRYGGSMGLTQMFLGPDAARRLTEVLRARGSGSLLSPRDGVQCERETGQCRVGDNVDEALTTVLYGPWPVRTGRAWRHARLSRAEWRWLGSQYGDDTEARPAEPARYTRRLLAEGWVRGGRGRMARKSER